MVSRGEDRYVVWPIYFDKSASRLSGRKVSKKQAVEKPSLEDIAKVDQKVSSEGRFMSVIMAPDKTGKKKQKEKEKEKE